MSASWPTSVATDSTLYIAVNELQNNLSAAINNAVTTVGLNSTTSFPTVGLVLIDNEIIKYTGISGNNLTGCTRAFDGTTAAAHSSAAVVSFAFCAAHHNNLKDEIIAIETSLNLTASKALSTDTNGRVAVATTTLAELNFLSGVTSAVQTQLNAKFATASLKAPTVQRFLSGSGTYTTPAGALWLRVTVVGPGGGGSGGGTAANAGSAGSGATTFAAGSCSAGAGSGGAAGLDGGAGGTNAITTSGSIIALQAIVGGQGGGSSYSSSSAAANFPGNIGGSTPLGGGATGFVNSGTGHSGRSNTGEGGAGGGSGTTGANNFCGSGGGGGGYIQYIVTSPSATYAYSIGTGGAGGTTTAGAGGTGGTGASGQVIVEEFYQ